MHTTLSTLILFACLALPQSTFAYTAREGNVTTILGPFSSKTNFQKAETDLEAPQMGGMGLIAIGDINEKGSLEIAMLYMHKVFLRESGPNYLAESIETIHITMGYRKWLSERFSAALTFYSAYPMGDPVTIYRQVLPSVSMDTSAQDLTEYGLDFSLQTELWASGRYGLIFDMRYAYSLTSKRDERGDHYGALFGIRYLLQGK